MNFNAVFTILSLTKVLQRGRVMLLMGVAAFGMVSCGGGGGGEDDKNIVAPRSLEGISMRLFNAFDLEFIRSSGVRDSETGGFVYVQRAPTFRYESPEGLGRTVALPVALRNTKYTYVRTGDNTGKISLTYLNDQVYPYPLATAEQPNPIAAQAEMFWGGRTLPRATELILDVLFVDNNGFLTVNTTRVRSAYIYLSSFAAGVATSEVRPFEFDTIDAQLSLRSRPVPTGYDYYDNADENAPTGVVWASLTKRTVDFDGSDMDRRIAFQLVTGVGPSIPNVERPQESGTCLIDDGNGTKGADGTYSYARTGRNGAKLTISYQTRVTPPTTPPTTALSKVTYALEFDKLNSGTFVDTNGAIGDFSQDLFTNQ